MSSSPPTILIPHGKSTSSCGYCGPPGGRSEKPTSATVGASALQLSSEIYQKMIDVGWRRSGTYNYRPLLEQTCCPQYSIRLDALAFEPTRNHRKALYRFNRLIIDGDSDGVQGLDSERTGDDAATEGMTNAKKPVKVKPRKQIFSLVDSIHEAETSFRTSSDVTPKHRFEITLELASFTNEKFELYKDYQFHIHKEIEKKASSFEHFLCDTCLVSTPIPYNGTPPSHLPRYYGTHHQLYRIDGELVAMSVLDILPNCVSGVYFMYASKWEKCQLGKLSVLREAALVREMYATGLKELKWVYLGFYIQSCQKMRYKGDYSPSYLLDTESYSWYPLSECTPLLDKYRYACFSNPSHSANEVVLHKFPEKKQKHMNDIKIAQISGAQFVHSPLSKQPTKVWASHKERIVQTVDALGSELSRSVYFRL